MIKSVVLVSSMVLLGFIEAYDFDDPQYNQILAQDLEELQLENSLYPTNPRRRRDGEVAPKDEKCRKKRFKSCCEEEFLQELKDEEKALKKECYKQVTGKDYTFGGYANDPFRCENVEKHKRDITCVAHCAAQKRGVIDEDGRLNTDELTKKVNEKLSKKEWLKQHLDDFINKCTKEAEEADAKRDKDRKDTCSPVAIKLGHCLWREIQIACPTDLITDEKKCNKIRDDINKKVAPVFEE